MKAGNLLTILALLILLALDRLIKMVLLKSPSIFAGDFWLIDFKLPHINSGLALGLPANNLIIAVASLIIIIVILWHWLKLFKRKTALIFYWGLILAGALSNLWDRIAFGGIVDYLSLSFLPGLFNLSDVFIFLGAVLLIINWKRYC